MTTFRIVRRSRFTTVDQRTVNDSQLSFRARGILIWLLDKPDDWRAGYRELVHAGTDGQYAVRAALKELREAGYIVQRKYQTADGKWATENTVYERPLGDGAVDNSPTETRLPKLGSPKLGSPTLITKTETKDLDQPPTPTDGFKIPEWLAEEAGRRIVEHREAHGYGKAGPGALKAAVAEVDRRLLAQWFNDGHPDHEIVRCLASRVTEPEAHASPTVYFKRPDREPEPTLERVRELLL